MLGTNSGKSEAEDTRCYLPAGSKPLWMMVCTVAWAAAYCKDGAAQEAIPPPPKIYRSVNCDAQSELSLCCLSLLLLLLLLSPHSSNGRIKFKVSSQPSLSVGERRGGEGRGVFWTVEQVNFEFALG